MTHTKNPAIKADLQSQLKEVELQLKALQQQFVDIKKHARGSVSGSRRRDDERKIAELRKQLGLQ